MCLLQCTVCVCVCMHRERECFWSLAFPNNFPHSLQVFRGWQRNLIFLVVPSRLLMVMYIHGVRCLMVGNDCNIYTVSGPLRLEEDSVSLQIQCNL